MVSRLFIVFGFLDTGHVYFVRRPEKTGFTKFFFHSYYSLFPLWFLGIELRSLSSCFLISTRREIAAPKHKKESHDSKVLRRRQRILDRLLPPPPTTTTLISCTATTHSCSVLCGRWTPVTFLT